MAGNRYQQPIINVNVTVVQQGDKIQNIGDNIENQTNISHSTIGTISQQGPDADVGQDEPRMDFGGAEMEQPNYDQSPSRSTKLIARSSSQSDSPQCDAEGHFKLSDTITINRNERLSKHAQIYRGQLLTEEFGPQPIAVKLLDPNEGNVKEAKILQDLSPHPNVVTHHHSDVCNWGPIKYIYIAMELCLMNLYDYMKQNKKNNVPFDPDLSMSFAHQVALGLDSIHKNGVINRDLKPQNILIDFDGKTLKITDFGLSKQLLHGRSQTKQSVIGSGVDGYRAPETYNDDLISKSSDIYSLALVFYYIWSNGGHPFGDDPDEWNINIKKNQNRDLSQLLIPDKDAAKDLLKRMLQFDPKERPSTEQILQHPVFWKKTTDQE